MDPKQLSKERPTAVVGNYTVTISPKLGSGSYGQVYEAVDNTTGRQCAVKQIDLMQDGDFNLRFWRRAEKELSIIKRLQKHDNIVKLFDVVTLESSCWIFMEHCCFKNLKSYLLHKDIRLNLLSKVKLKLQCAGAIAFMHAQKPPIIHRDIKLENILMTIHYGEHVAKITDFGLSRLLEEHSASQKGMRTFAGTRHYMAPEQFQGLEYDKSVDVFALGLAFAVLYDFTSLSQRVIPLSVTSREKPKAQQRCMGEEMVSCHENNQPMPDMMLYSSSDTASQRTLKNIIQKMIQFRNSDRIGINGVKDALAGLFDQMQIESGIVKARDSPTRLEEPGSCHTSFPTSSDDEKRFLQDQTSGTVSLSSKLSGFSGGNEVQNEPHMPCPPLLLDDLERVPRVQKVHISEASTDAVHNAGRMAAENAQALRKVNMAYCTDRAEEQINKKLRDMGFSEEQIAPAFQQARVTIGHSNITEESVVDIILAQDVSEETREITRGSPIETQLQATHGASNRQHRQRSPSTECTLNSSGVGRCNLCNVQFTSRQHTDQHLEGKKHLRNKVLWETGRLPEMPIPPAAQDYFARGSLSQLEVKSSGLEPAQQYHCDVCDVYVNSMQQLSIHKRSPKHVKKDEQKRRLQEFRRSQSEK